jgi:hypothetical protein
LQCPAANRLAKVENASSGFFWPCYPERVSATIAAGQIDCIIAYRSILWLGSMLRHVVWRLRKQRIAQGWSWMARGCLVAAVIVLAGCGGASEVPVGDAAENIRKLALGYVQYAATNRGVGPANQQALTKFMVERNALPQEEVEKSFVSIRDNQPYIVRWGLRPQGSGPLGAEAPKPIIIIMERTGADGTRYVADSRPEISQMTEEELKQQVPDFESLK